MRALAMLLAMATVAGAEPKTDHLDGTMVARVIKAKKATLRVCYGKLLAADPKRTAVTLVVQFTIVDSGGVSEAALERSVEAKFDDCILGTFKAMKFPSGKFGKMSVNYPLVFRADDTPKETSDESTIEGGLERNAVLCTPGTGRSSMDCLVQLTAP